VTHITHGQQTASDRVFAAKGVPGRRGYRNLTRDRLAKRKLQRAHLSGMWLVHRCLEHRMSISMTLTVNGVLRTIELDDPRVTLLDLLRERLHLTGTKKGCDRGQCGACTVLVEGRRINSCLALALSHDGADVLTIEGVARGDRLHPVQEAFLAHDGLQCGFCTPGQIMSAIGLIQEGEAGDDPERVREGMSGNLCRCAAYQGITEAVLEAQKAPAAESRREVA
jgi:xanthine dehydrogenase YagT iron-sulfur-binding subunit